MTPLELLPNVYRPFFGRFPSLTDAQKALIEPVLEGRDVVLQAGTGLGKTEAILAPVTERLLVSEIPFTILYIVPTKALALDMHRRIRHLYKQLDLKVGMRTGDSKTHCQIHPHLLILTPESLDVFLGSQNLENRAFLKQVHVLIIDEVHVFLHTERGQQLAHLRHRLALQCQGSLQTLTLSATIGGPEEITLFFGLNHVFHYRQSGVRSLEPYWVHLQDEESELIPFFHDLFARWGCKKLLVFANSRQKCEQLLQILQREGVFAQHVLLHYSNLSTRERRFVEAAFKEKKMSVCIATSTLEMGIDIGDIDGVVLIGPPPSTMAFLQRIGRGNRRQSQVRFWGVCYGCEAELQLLRFLALFALAEEGQVEKIAPAGEYSVLFQQILSCLYEKKILSPASLERLFQKKNIPMLLESMQTKEWLKPMPQPGLLCGGWRYAVAWKKQLIWSNFPPTDQEFDVILEREIIAKLPLAIIKQLEVGSVVQLTGKIVKILQMERTHCEVLVEQTDADVTVELAWYGLGLPTSFEVAEKMRQILFTTSVPRGLLHRTKRMLQKMQVRMRMATRLSDETFVRRLLGGAYRYETFLGSIGNFILQQAIKAQFSSQIPSLSVSFDATGVECNVWLSLHSLQLPASIPLFQRFVQTHLVTLKQIFLWNSWLHHLPQELQEQEIMKRFLDERVLERFGEYRKMEPVSPPEHVEEELPESVRKIPLVGTPWSIQEEKSGWGELVFAPFSEKEMEKCSLTASHLRQYIAHKLCPRLAYFQRNGFIAESHPRFRVQEEERFSQRQKQEEFHAEVIGELEKKYRVCPASDHFTWKEAVEKVISTGEPLFFMQPILAIQDDLWLRGRPDCIYLKPDGNSVYAEVWDIGDVHGVSYAQKWQIAMYAYLLEESLKITPLARSVKVAHFGGVIHRHREAQKLLDRTYFSLRPFREAMPQLLRQWKKDAKQNSLCSMDSSCTSCVYFSYCYQESFLRHPPSLEEGQIRFLGTASNQFPNNTKQWFFLSCLDGQVKWECWEGGEFLAGGCANRVEYLPLYTHWIRSMQQGKNPHILVLAEGDWYAFKEICENTPLSSIWAMHSCWTSIQSVLEEHFVWPFAGSVTCRQVALCLGMLQERQAPLSLYHQEPWQLSTSVYRKIWNWCLSHVQSRRMVESGCMPSGPLSMIQAYRAVLHREQECRTHAILEFQKNPLPQRVEKFRAIGPLRFVGVEGPKRYRFSLDSKAPIAKFKIGDYLRLSLVGSRSIQEGVSVILESYCPDEGWVMVRSLLRRIPLHKHQLYALDECATDWNAPKMDAVLQKFRDPYFRPEILRMLQGGESLFTQMSIDWIEAWYASHSAIANLNALQRQALFLPFFKNVGLIEGPPGTGKTHLLVWTLVALCAQAKSIPKTHKILVTAQTHQAIDQILQKTAQLLQTLSMEDVLLWKQGRYDQAQLAHFGVKPLENVGSLTEHLSCCIVGATGFGIYQFMEGTTASQIFDWVVFDESSQVLPAYALLSLIFGKGKALFYGDTQQLPPVVMGNYADVSLPPRSILEELLARYPSEHRLRLHETYRMNETICQFASQNWYQNELVSAVPKALQRWDLPKYPIFGDTLDRFLDPDHPIEVVLVPHEGCEQSSREEALWIAEAVKRCMQEYVIPAEEIGIISPHRLQNNTILYALKETLPSTTHLPKVDTVERMQGAEFDVVFFSATVSDKKTIHSRFLRDYRRFNVALTRARKKFLFVASPLFFDAFPATEKQLIAQAPFQELFKKFGGR